MSETVLIPGGRDVRASLDSAAGDSDEPGGDASDGGDPEADAIVVACDPGGEPARYTGSATPVGSAARACVREALTASYRSRYSGRKPPESVADAEHGESTTCRATVFEP